MNFLLDLNYSEKLPFSDALSYGLQNFLLGLGTVFSVLIILWIILTLFKLVFHDLANKKQKKKEPVANSVPVETPVVARYNAEDEVIVAIAAAIAMAESESDGVKFRVVSFRRK